LQNNLHRWYDASVGRWLSEDPIGFEGGDENLHRYVRNMPYVNVDPQGLVTCEPGQCDIAVHGYTIKALELIIHKAARGESPYIFIRGDDPARNAESFREGVKSLAWEYMIAPLGDLSAVFDLDLKQAKADRDFALRPAGPYQRTIAG